MKLLAENGLGRAANGGEDVSADGHGETGVGWALEGAKQRYGQKPALFQKNNFMF